MTGYSRCQDSIFGGNVCIYTYVLSVVVVKVPTDRETSPRTRANRSVSTRRRSLDGVDSSGDKMTITTIPTVGVYSSSDKKTIATIPAFQDDLLSASPLEIRPQIRVNVVELIYD